jgi:hypothetical protein
VAVREVVKIPPVPAPTQITITVGIHGDDGAEHHEERAANDIGRAVGGDLTVAQVGTFHEFGVEPFQMPSGAMHAGIPQRSFIRAWYDESQEFVRETLMSQMKLVIKGKLTAEKAGERIALAFEGSMKRRISKGIAPPLAASTIEAKGSSKPLIDQGQLRNSIRGKAEFK